tara:strand:- start:1417 stop:1863 length:447 start_codon:yes stop_codon:yes gene_type:complete
MSEDIKMKYFFFKLILFLLVPFPVLAGGSVEVVKIKSFERIGSTSYVLVIIPSADTKDFYMKGCSEFTVKGSFPWINFFNPNPHLTKDSHIAALDFIAERFNSEGQILNLGAMGRGFERIEAEKPCVVKSKALDYREGLGVMSYYHPV